MGKTDSIEQKSIGKPGSLGVVKGGSNVLMVTFFIGESDTVTAGLIPAFHTYSSYPRAFAASCSR